MGHVWEKSKRLVSPEWNELRRRKVENEIKEILVVPIYKA